MRGFSAKEKQKMKAKRHSEKQILGLLREAETWAGRVEDFCRAKSISEQTFYRWRRKYEGMTSSEAAKLRKLEVENTRLKKLVVERDLEIEVMKEIAAKKW
jgi:putative transposase